MVRATFLEQKVAVNNAHLFQINVFKSRLTSDITLHPNKLLNGQSYRFPCRRLYLMDSEVIRVSGLGFEIVCKSKAHFQ